MGYIASLRLFLLGLLEHARAWNERVTRSNSSSRDDDTDDLYDIFLFGPHG